MNNSRILKYLVARLQQQMTKVLDHELIPTGILLQEVSLDNGIAKIFIVHHHHPR